MSDMAKMLLRGAAVGLGASLIQVMVGKAEEKLLPLPPHEDANIAPRFIGRITARLDRHASKKEKWVVGTLFHFGYGAAWGAGYAAAIEKRPVAPLAGGTALGLLIYGITFPRWGVAVRSDTERRPEHRTARMQIVTWSVAMTFGLATALLYGRPQQQK